MKRRSALALGAIVMAGLMAAPASAGFYSGKDLLQACTTDKDHPDYFEKSHECAAYVAGAVDAFNTTREANKLKSCLPADVTIRQMRDVTVDYLLAHADAGKTSASTLVFAATRKAWPCKAKSKAKPRRRK